MRVMIAKWRGGWHGVRCREKKESERNYKYKCLADGNFKNRLL